MSREAGPEGALGLLWGPEGGTFWAVILETAFSRTGAAALTTRPVPPEEMPSSGLSSTSASMRKYVVI